MQRINNLYEMISWVNLLLHTAWCVWLQEETSKKPLWHFWSHSLHQQQKKEQKILKVFFTKFSRKQKWWSKSYKQILSVWWTENLRSKLHHVAEMINRTLSPQIYLMISFWDQLTEHTSHVLFIATLKSDSSHSPWTDAFSHHRITGTVNTWCIFIKTSILRNESGVGNVWKNSGKSHNRYLISMKKSL